MSSENRYLIKSISFNQTQRRFLVDWKDGHQSRFPYIWLRHEQFFPTIGRSNQEDDGLYPIHESPKSPAIVQVKHSQQDLIISWSHDQSHTRHCLVILRDNCPSSIERATRLSKPNYWMGEDANCFPWFACSDLVNNASRLEIFEHLIKYGIALIKDVPCVSGTIESLATNFGPVRTTHFGGLFNIRSRPRTRQTPAAISVQLHPMPRRPIWAKAGATTPPGSVFIIA